MNITIVEDISWLRITEPKIKVKPQIKTEWNFSVMHHRAYF